MGMKISREVKDEIARESIDQVVKKDKLIIRIIHIQERWQEVNDRRDLKREGSVEEVNSRGTENQMNEDWAGTIEFDYYNTSDLGECDHEASGFGTRHFGVK